MILCWALPKLVLKHLGKATSFACEKFCYGTIWLCVKTAKCCALAWDQIVKVTRTLNAFIFAPLGNAIGHTFEFIYKTIKAMCSAIWGGAKYVGGKTWDGARIVGHATHKFVLVPIGSAAVSMYSTLKKYVLIPTYNGITFIMRTLWKGFTYIMKALWNAIVYVWDCFKTIYSLIKQNILIPIWNGFVWVWEKFVKLWLGFWKYFCKFLYWTIFFPSKWVCTKLWKCLVILKQSGYQYLALPFWNNILVPGKALLVYIVTSCRNYIFIPIYNLFQKLIVQPTIWLIKTVSNGVSWVYTRVTKFVSIVAETAYKVIILGLIYPIFKFVGGIIEQVIGGLSRVYKAIVSMFG